MASLANPKNPSGTEVSASSPQEQLSDLTPSQLHQLASTATPVIGPVANAASVMVVLAMNDAMLVFSRPRRLITSEGAFANIAVNETTGIIHMSMASLKDTYLAIGDTILNYEKQFGQIDTQFTRQRDAAKK